MKGLKEFRKGYKGTLAKSANDVRYGEIKNQTWKWRHSPVNKARRGAAQHAAETMPHKTFLMMCWSA